MVPHKKTERGYLFYNKNDLYYSRRMEESSIIMMWNNYNLLTSAIFNICILILLSICNLTIKSLYHFLSSPKIFVKKPRPDPKKN